MSNKNTNNNQTNSEEHLDSREKEHTLPTEDDHGLRTTRLSGMYKDWFLDYASYVILERAVPEIRDGLKPVQKRILHAMKELDDGRYNKVANIIGHAMKYHPHGDASIGDALVQLGQKGLLVDTQGNWGNIFTGDSSAAPRYIEARPSKFALEVIYNPKTTVWKQSYDGRNQEPAFLPVKFPLLLAQGVEGIAVGLASKILPHNFNELLDSSIKYLEGETPDLVPDFPTGGMADFTKYNNGQRGGKVRIRAKINIIDKKTLTITELPFGVTTGSLIESILNANDKGKIKIKKIEDNTAEHVEIAISLSAGISPDQAIDALYAFTYCEVSISPNCCVIKDGKPCFLSINDILETSTDNTVALLKKELEIKKHELLEQHMFSSLEKIFIENRIYRDIEECETWEAVISAINNGLEPYKHQFYRDINHDDIIRLTEIKIKRISKFDSLKADEIIKNLESELEKVNKNLKNLVKYAIDYFKYIKKKFGKGRERKTEIRYFDNIEAKRVAVANQKLYVNRSEGFVGTGLKKDEYVCDCSDIDDIIVFREDGSFIVTKVDEKSFVGKDVLHVAVFKRNDDRTIYNMIYRDGPNGKTFMKRFAIKGVTRDREYDLTKGTKGSKVLYLTANPNGEAELITVHLRHKPKLKKPVFDLDFSELSIKSRNAAGNILTKHQVRKIVLKDEGVSTLGAQHIWFDSNILRLNVDKRGQYVGSFKGDEKILTIFSNGTYRLMSYDLSSHFDDAPVIMEKYESGKIITAIYYDGEQEHYYVKRFEVESTDKIVSFIGEHPESKLVKVSVHPSPVIKVTQVTKAKKIKSDEEIPLEEFISIKGIKARGKRVTQHQLESVDWIKGEPSPPEPPKEDDDKAKKLQGSAVRKSEHAFDSEHSNQISIDF